MQNHTKKHYENANRKKTKTFNKKKLLPNLWTKNDYKKKLSFSLTLSWRRSLSYRNQSIDLLSKSMEWFLNDRDICHERVINKEKDIFTTLLRTYGDTFLRKWLKKAKMVKSQFQYFLNIFGFSRPFSTKCSVCCF